MSVRLRLLAGGLVLLALAGCGGPGREPAAQPADPPAPAGPQLPPRPRTIELAGVDPCSLLTDTQRKQLGVNQGDPGRSADSAPVHSSSYCDWANEPRRPSYSYTGGLVDNLGAEFALGLEPLRSVQGFAATTTTALGTDPRWYCGMYVDVAPGRALQVTFDNGPRDYPGMNHQLACDKAQQLADAMLTTFTSR
ncbi:MAG: DUF3558 domain-containing protein [Pseudonocardia sp.]